MPLKLKRRRGGLLSAGRLKRSKKRSMIGMGYHKVKRRRLMGGSKRSPFERWPKANGKPGRPKGWYTAHYASRRNSSWARFLREHLRGKPFGSVSMSLASRIYRSQLQAPGMAAVDSALRDAYAAVRPTPLPRPAPTPSSFVAFGEPDDMSHRLSKADRQAAYKALRDKKLAEAERWSWRDYLPNFG